MFSRLQHEPEKARQAVYQGTAVVTFFSYPVFLGLAVLSPEAVAVAFGDKWAPVTELIWAFCLLGFYSASMIMFIGVCMGLGHPGYVLLQRVIGVLLNIAVFVCVVRYGIFWVAIAFAARAFLTSPFQLWLMRKASGIEYGRFVRALMAPAATTGVSVGVGFGLRLLIEPYTSALPRLVICVLAIALVHAALVWRFSPSVFAQIKLMLSARGKPAPVVAVDPR